MTERATSLVAAPPALSSVSTGRIVALARAQRRQLELVFAVSLYFGFACQLTWPVIIHLTHSVYAIPGDPYGTMAMYRELVNHHVNPFLPGILHQFAAPEGLPVPWPRNLASAPGILTLYLFTSIFGPVAALSVYTLAGYVLTGTVTFLFARRLTGNAWAALIAGWAYAFYPFAIINGLGHNDNVQGWVLMLAVWRMVELMWHPTRRNGVLAGLAVVLAMWWSPYFILFGASAYITITAAALLLAWRGGNLRAMLKAQLLPALIVFVFLVYLAVLSTLGSGETGVRINEIRDLYAFAARPLEYLLPDPRSPVLGGATRHYIETHQHGSGGIEDTLYIGVTVILLALVAAGALILRKLSARVGGGVLALWLLVVAAIAISLPPEVSLLGAKIPFPSHFISQITTTWRIYSRFVIVVMLATSVLAAVGLEVITRKRTLWAAVAIMSVATILVPLDLWYRQPGTVAKLSTPAIYKILAHQPMGLVAEYPLPPSGGNEYNDIYYRNVYNKPILTAYDENSIQELRATSLYNLAYPSTAQRLAALGVRYVVVDAYPPDWGWPPSGPPGAGFRLIATEPYASLYAVTAKPQGPALATVGPGFTIPEVTATGTVSWLEHPTGTIALAGNCTRCEGMLQMTLASAGPPQKAALVDSHGHVLAQGPVSGYTLVKIPLTFSKYTALTLRAAPQHRPSTHSGDSDIHIQITGLGFVANDKVDIRDHAHKT